MTPVFDCAYAYSPTENVGSRGGYHLVVLQPITHGRLQRQPLDPLCKRKFWGLDGGRDLGEVSCVQCLRTLAKLPEEYRAPVVAAIRAQLRHWLAAPDNPFNRRVVARYRARLAMLGVADEEMKG